MGRRGLLDVAITARTFGQRPSVMLLGSRFAECEPVIALDLDNAATILLLRNDAQVARDNAARTGADRAEDGEDDTPQGARIRRRISDQELIASVFGDGAQNVTIIEAG